MDLHFIFYLFFPSFTQNTFISKHIKYYHSDNNNDNDAVSWLEKIFFLVLFFLFSFFRSIQFYGWWWRWWQYNIVFGQYKSDIDINWIIKLVLNEIVVLNQTKTTKKFFCFHIKFFKLSSLLLWISFSNYIQFIWDYYQP